MKRINQKPKQLRGGGSVTSLTLSLEETPDIYIWNAVMGLFTNSNYWIDLNQNPGVHVHARKTAKGRKVIDKTFGEVKIIETGEIYNQKIANENRLKQLQNGDLARKIKEGRIIRPQIIVETDKIKQADSFAIIACTPSCYSSGDRKEETGVHWHTYKEGMVVQDFTAKEVIMDGDIITEEMSTNLAIQRDFAKTRSLLVGYLLCNFCDTPILSTGESAFNNQTEHHCSNCDSNHFSEVPCISNPIIKTFNRY